MGGQYQMGLKGIGCEDTDCIHLVHDSDQWRAVLNRALIYGIS